MKLYADVFKARGKTDSIFVPDFSTAQGDASWQKTVVDLKPYKTKKFVVLKLRADAELSGNPVYPKSVIRNSRSTIF